MYPLRKAPTVRPKGGVMLVRTLTKSDDPRVKMRSHINMGKVYPYSSKRQKKRYAA